jgi:hypothetical protein
LTNGARRTTKLSQPQAVRNHHLPLVAVNRLAAVEQPARQRRHLEQRQHLRRDSQPQQAFGTTGEADIGPPVFRRPHRRERPVLSSPVIEVGERHRGPSTVHDDDQAVGVPVLERTEEDRLHRAEHRGVRPDRDRQDHYDAGAHRRRPPDRPGAIAHIAPQALDRSRAPRIAVGLADLFQTAERAPCRQPRLLGREAGGARVPFCQLEVSCHLVIELTVQAIAAKEGQQPLDHGSHDLAPRKRATRAIDCSQLAISSRS